MNEYDILSNFKFRTKHSTYFNLSHARMWNYVLKLFFTSQSCFAYVCSKTELRMFTQLLQGLRSLTIPDPLYGLRRLGLGVSTKTVDNSEPHRCI